MPFAAIFAAAADIGVADHRPRIDQGEIAADETVLHDPDLYARDPERFGELTERIARNRAEVEAMELRWLEVAEMAEALEH